MLFFISNKKQKSTLEHTHSSHIHEMVKIVLKEFAQDATISHSVIS